MSGKRNANLPKGYVVCPPDCPNRSAEPNCHNVETCERWAQHVERQRLLYADRDAWQESRARITPNHKRWYVV